jgi:mannose-6-phosphate isomerase-like protein (cupin superfamily)
VRKVSTVAAEHYTWGDACDGWHLVRRPELSVIRERMPPGTSEARHLHRAARQFFFILSGTAILEVGGSEFALAVGEGLEIAPRTPHQVFNRSDEDVEFLVVSQPHSHGDREPVAE